MEERCSAARIELMVKNPYFWKEHVVEWRRLVLVFPGTRDLPGSGTVSPWEDALVDQLPRCRNSSRYCCALWGPPSWS